jgi:hypothetical protein
LGAYSAAYFSAYSEPWPRGLARNARQMVEMDLEGRIGNGEPTGEQPGFFG